MRREDLEAHLPGSPGCTPRAPPPSGLGLRLPITYINSEHSLGPSAGPRPTSVPHANPLAPDGGWEGWPCVGDPRALLLTSPLPQPTLPTSCFSSFSPNPPSPPSKSKNQTMLSIGSCWSPHTTPPPPPPRPPRGPRRVPAPPALILSSDDSHHHAGLLTTEATGPPPPSASQRESSPASPRLGEAGPP